MHKAFEYLRRIRDHLRRRGDPFRGWIKATTDEIWYTDNERTTWCIPWTNVRKIAAFKRDLFTTDLICWELELDRPFWRGCWDQIRFVEINEEMEGFQGVVDAAVRRKLVDPHWVGLVMQPAFATCWTVIYDSSVPKAADVDSPAVPSA